MFLLPLFLALTTLFPLSIAADSTSSSSSPIFNFHDYLIGEWDVLKADVSYSPPTFDFSPYRGRYLFDKENGTSNLIGRYFDNHTETGEVENELRVLIEFEDTANGHWKTGKDVDSLTSLFPFSFVTHPSGHPTTVGEWHGADDSYYLLQINAPDKFTITVTPKQWGAGGEEPQSGEDVAVTVYSLRKKPEPVAKGFFQQYGTYLMLIVFFVVNLFLKSRAATSAATTASTSAPASTSVAAKKTK